MKLGADVKSLDGKGRNVLEASLELRNWKIQKFLAYEDFMGLQCFEKLNNNLSSDFEDDYSLGTEWLGRIMKEDEEETEGDVENEEDREIIVSKDKNVKESGRRKKEKREEVIKKRLVARGVVKGVVLLLKRKDPPIEDIYRVR